MSIAHVISSIATQKKHETQKNFRHKEIMISTTFFVSRFFRTRYENKVISCYNTKKKFIITHKNESRIILMFIEYNEKFIFKLIL